MPKLSVSMFLAALARSYGQALEMVYVEPYRTGGRRPQGFTSVCEDGRNPDW
jgi:hypothetical protein